MNTYLIAKYVHLLVVALLFSSAAVLHSSLARVKKAERVPQALDAMGTVAWMAPKMPLLAVLLLLTGGYLAQTSWTFKLPWIQVSIAALISIPLIAGILLRPRMAAIGMLLGKAGDGPIPDEVRALLAEPMLWITSHYPPTMAATIMYLMVVKPEMTGSLIAIGVGAALALGSAVPMMKKG